MGCDIHMYVEYRKSIKGNDVWVNGDYFKFNPYFKVFDDESQYSKLELHGDRNYTLFATLAGVRDYTGKVIPVHEPKGMPEDSCEYIKQDSDRWDGDGHTHSWLTLKELKDYGSNPPKMQYTGLLSPTDLVAFDADGKTPESWCQGTNIKGYERREWATENTSLAPLIEKIQKRAHELMQYDWQDYDTANDEKIRIVFWFDN